MSRIQYELRRVRLGAVAFKGQTTESNPVTTNRDGRVAVQGGAGVSGDGNVTIVEAADADAVKAVASMGADTFRSIGEAVVKLNETSTTANRDTWDKTVSAGAALVDKLIDQSTTLGGAAIASFKPVENSNADIGKYAMIAAACVAGAVLLKGSK